MSPVISFPNPASDDGERERIRSSLDESLIVEAAAGTGKTTELIHRLVGVLRRGPADVDGVPLVARVVAVTFTRKAAGELKLRLRQELDWAIAQARERAGEPRAGQEQRQAEADTENLEQAIAHLEQARIGTIHSFCAELLRERPVEANVDPAFKELDDGAARRLFHKAFQAWIQELLQDPPPGVRRALRRLATRQWRDQSPLAKLEFEGWQLIEWRDFTKPWQRPECDLNGEIDVLAKKTLELADLIAPCNKPGDKLLIDLHPVSDFATRLRRSEGESQEHERNYDVLEALLVRMLGALKSHRRKGQGAWLGPGVPRDKVVTLREQLIGSLETFREHADADLAALLQQEMRSLAERYQASKRAEGKLDFVDLLLLTRDMIRGNAEVRGALQKKFSRIFVDEFQDTDPLQAEILLLLAADDPAETHWESARPQPGKLFLVGDPKQSIYRFRRADVLLYQRVRDALTAFGVEVTYLRKSYRAVPDLQQAVNAAFAPEMTGNLMVGQPPYVALERFRQAREGQPWLIGLPAPDPYDRWGRAGNWAIEKCMPQAVAAFVDWLLRESANLGWRICDPELGETEIKPRHICLLFRRFMSWGNDMTGEYLRELECRDIPHLLVGAKSFYSREEVEMLRSALAAVEWPDDELSVFTTLRGPLFAISDNTLLVFRHSGYRFHPFSPLPEEVDPELAPVKEALGILARLHRQRNRRPVVETLNELLEATRAHAGLAMRPSGNQVLASVYRLCDLARSFEMSGGISFRGFIEELIRQQERDEGSDAPVFEDTAEGVRLMTVHAAKGLEFPVVILADPTAKISRPDPDKFVDGSEELCAMRILGCAPWDLLDHAQDEAERDRAEGVRVAYVAATRARDLLVICADPTEPTSDGWLSPLNKIVYPQGGQRRASSAAAGCPPFGKSTVLQGYSDEHLLESTIKPGFHRPSPQAPGIVWWDPKALNLRVNGNYGLRRKEILAEDAGATESIQQYEEWKQRWTRVTEQARRAEFEVITVTDTNELPPNPKQAVEVEMMPRAADRPGGRRFGTLLHLMLRDVALPGEGSGGTPIDVARLARLHGHILGAADDEVQAAISAASTVLTHSLLRRAGAAASCHREFPILARTEAGRLIEGTLDLAFVEDGEWVIVDFKSDADLPARCRHYEQQLRWYMFALTQVTGLPARAHLLGV
jgi:ATP-dependent exoDNAse (exonuclease V) beta subunit